ncbi:pyocin knob domain-containing S74 family peptidase [Chromobacterium vaccinii]|uniref:pyocin knob domain-containing S74 family peptidase n=1 Tax=Chromobacterium vaccinii TaxID=1108595 RepID=UPI001E4C0EA5|nr:pyocin knob domain-containing S74 family peptidase [Chromobacterium vaccinii]MCD4483383.1 pyocin knob domain-containing S74 family peptidase [Chromobacterium vaccinii]
MSVDTNWYRVGRISVAQGGVEVRGEGTSWEGQTSEGDILIGPDGRWYEVAAVGAAEALQLRTSYLGATVKAQPYAVVRNFTGSQLGRVAADLAKMQRRWLSTLGGFRDVLFSDQPQATLYDELGDAHVVMPWPAIESAVKTALTKVEAARVVVVDNAADLIAARDSAQESAKAAKASQDVAAASVTATKASQDAAGKSQTAVAAAEKRVAASATAADASAKAAKLSQDAAAASADSVAGAAQAVEEARELVKVAVKRGEVIRVNSSANPDKGFVSLSPVHSGGSGALFAQSATGGALIDLDPQPLDGVSGASLRAFRNIKTTGPALVDIHVGDGSATIQHRIGASGSDTLLHQEGGRVQIGRAGMPSRLDVVGQSRADTVRAGKGYPDKGDSSRVGYGFDDDADTGLFADYEGDKPMTGTKNLAFFINSKKTLEVDLQGRVWSQAYGFLENKFADKPYVDAAVAKIVDSAPEALNTLKELSAALNNDGNFANTIAGQLAKKLEAQDLASYGMGGNAQNVGSGELTDKRPNGFYHAQSNAGKGVKGAPGNAANGMMTVNYLSDKWGVITYRAWGGEVYEARLENGTWSDWNRHWHTGNDGALLMYRQALGKDVDLNTCRQNGWFWQGANANAATGSNYPWPVAGALSVLEQGSMTFQQYQTYHPDGPQLYIRNRYNERWGDWVKVWHSGNHGPGSGLNADTVDGLQAADLLALAGDQQVTGNKRFLAPLTSQPNGSSWKDWATDARWGGLQVACPSSGSAYTVWRAVQEGQQRQLAALAVCKGGNDDAVAQVVLHLGGPGVNDMPHLWQGNDYRAAGNIEARNKLLTGNLACAMAKGDQAAALEVRANVNGNGDKQTAAMAFHVPGVWAVKLALRHDGVFGLGGWSADEWRWFVDTKTGDMTASGNVTWFSDRRLKTDIQPIADALDKVRRLNGYTFTRTDTGARQVGLIAQEVQAVQPEAVIEAADEAKTLTVAYGNLVGLLVEALKEQQRNFEQLEARIAQLEAA